MPPPAARRAGPARAARRSPLTVRRCSALTPTGRACAASRRVRVCPTGDSGYSGTPLPRKLGIRRGRASSASSATPATRRELIAPLPPERTFGDRPGLPRRWSSSSSRSDGRYEAQLEPLARGIPGPLALDRLAQARSGVDDGHDRGRRSARSPPAGPRRQQGLRDRRDVVGPAPRLAQGAARRPTRQTARDSGIRLARVDDDVGERLVDRGERLPASSATPEAAALSSSCSGRDAPTIADGDVRLAQHPRERELRQRQARPRRRSDAAVDGREDSSVRNRPIAHPISLGRARESAGCGSPARYLPGQHALAERRPDDLRDPARCAAAGSPRARAGARASSTAAGSRRTARRPGSAARPRSARPSTR